MDGTMIAAPLSRVGRGPLEVPPFGFGAAPLGELLTKVPEAQALETIETAWEDGVRFFDTAPWYGHGLSEHRLGQVLRQKPRDDYVLTTKVGRIYRRPSDLAQYSSAPWIGGLPFEPVWDYSYDGVMRAYEQSLLRLGINRVDALAIHDLDPAHHPDEAVYEQHWRDLETSGIKALEELKSSGDIRAIGAGANSGDVIGRFAGGLDLDYLLVALPYTLLNQAALGDGGFDICAKRGVSIIIGSPFASGILADPTGTPVYAYKSAPEAIVQKVDRMRALCRTHGVALPAAALQFVLAHPLVVAVLAGAVSGAQIRENAARLAEIIPDEFWLALRAEGLIDPDAPTPSDGLTKAIA